MAKGMAAEWYRGRRCHVIGIARSGVNTVRLLRRLGASVSVSDSAPAEALGQIVREIPGDVPTFAGRQDSRLLEGVTLLIVSPGVPMDSGIVEAANAAGIEVTGEVELSFRIAQEISGERGIPVKWFGITGTNGKSTTTTLLYELLKRAGRDAVIAGNIGVPLSGEILKLLDDTEAGGLSVGGRDFVLELSSFQLETIERFRLDVSALLNVTEDHLDRYRSFDEYREAKARIFLNQDSQCAAVINADDVEVVGCAERCAADRYYVSTRQKVRGVYTDGGDIFLSTGAYPRVLARRADVGIPGVHNLYNAMTAALMASLAGVSDEVIRHGLREFAGLEHRIEFAGEVRGIRFYNDSKGTNIGAVIKSLESFDSGVILIAGGRDKNSDFRLLTPYLAGRVKKAVLIGEAASKIGDAIRGVVPVAFAGTLREAVDEALKGAQSGDTILLSPACASFDMFRNYEDRGRQFKERVRELMGAGQGHA